jgi:hypothetical protein
MQENEKNESHPLIISTTTHVFHFIPLIYCFSLLKEQFLPFLFLPFVRNSKALIGISHVFVKKKGISHVE